MTAEDTTIRRQRRAPPRVISVVMPVCDAAHTVGCQLEALANQDYPRPWELLVVDTGSRDGTLELVAGKLEAFGAARLLQVENCGRNAASNARNAGAAAGAGDLFVFCDADDVASPAWLCALALAAEDADIVAGRLDVATLNRARVREWHEDRSGPWPTLRFLPRVSTAGCAVWRDVFDALEGFDEDHPGAEDIDFAWRAQLAGYRVGSAGNAVMGYRYRSGLSAVARQQYRWGTADVRLYRDFGPSGMSRAPLGEVLRAWTEILVAAPFSLWSQRLRGRWLHRSGRRVGRLVGSVQQRTIFL